MPVALKLIARNGIRLPHRMMAQGDALIPLLQFDNDQDAQFFKSQLRWTAFQFLPADGVKTLDGKPPEAEPLLAEGMHTGEVITADIFDLLAGASPEDLAQLKGLGPKKAAELIENAQAFVAARAEAEAKAKADAEANPS